MEDAETPGPPAPRNLAEALHHRTQGISDSRIAAAEAIRTLVNVFISKDIDDALLDGVASRLSEFVHAVEGLPRRERPLEGLAALMGFGDVEYAGTGPTPEDELAWEDGLRVSLWDSFAAGGANPASIGAEVRLLGRVAEARLTIDPAFEGAPGRGHGGALAAVFDEVTGGLLGAYREPAFTGRLTVNYLAPCPVGEEIRFRARLAGREGRKLFMEAEATSGGETIATCEALYIATRMD